MSRPNDHSELEAPSTDNEPADLSDSEPISRRNAIAVMAKYGAVTAPVMMTLFHGTDASAGNKRRKMGSGKGETRRRRRRRRRRRGRSY